MPTRLRLGLVDMGHGRWRVTFYFRSNVNAAAVRALAISAAGAAAGQGAALRARRRQGLGCRRVSSRAKADHGGTLYRLRRARSRLRTAEPRSGSKSRRRRPSAPVITARSRGCLLALDWGCASQQKARRILDLGTGSGVLAIAAAKSLRRQCWRSDIDAQAVRIACDNARLNRCFGLVRVCRANGLAAADIRASAPFDLVIANILLAPLQSLAAPLTGIVGRRGRIVLSGLLNAQASAARAFYPHFTLERRIAVDGWTTLVLRRERRPRQ